MQTEQLLCWSGMTDTERCTTSKSNEEEDQLILKRAILLLVFEHFIILYCMSAVNIFYSNFWISCVYF